MEILENLKDVFELATSATTLIKEITKNKNNKKKLEENNLIKVSRSNYARIGSSGYYAQIGSSGNSARIGSSGDSAQIGSSGDSAQIGSSGDYAQIGSSGDSAQIGSSGDSAQIGSSGDSAQIGSSGDYAQIGSSGDYAQIGSSGYYARIGSSGYYARIGSSGNYAQIGSSGNSAQIGSSGNYAVISAIGISSIIKAKKGSWITLAEYNNDNKPICVKSAQIDGVMLKEDTYYCLYDSEFKEVQVVDNCATIIEKQKNNIIKGRFLNTKEKCFIFEKNGVFAHGKTARQAYIDWLFKTSDRNVEQYKNIDKSEVYSLNWWVIAYRTITGACSMGTNNYLETNKEKYKKEMTLEDVLEATQGQYGHETFKEFFERNV